MAGHGPFTDDNYTGKRPHTGGGSRSMCNVPDTSNSSYGTLTEQVRHQGNCSSRTFYTDLNRRAHKSFIQELPMSIPEKLSYKPQCIIQGPLEEAFNKISARSARKDL